MSGVDLVNGTEPVITVRPGYSYTEWEQDRADVGGAVQSLRSTVRTEFLLSVLVIFVAIMAAVPKTPRVIHILVLLLALGATFSFVAGLTAGSEIFGPTVHHLYGFWSAAALSVIALLAAFIHSRASIEAPSPGPRLTKFNWAVVTGLVVGLAIGLAAEDTLGWVFVVAELVLVPVGFVAGLVSLVRFRPSVAALAATTAGGVPLALLIGMLV